MGKTALCGLFFYEEGYEKIKGKRDDTRNETSKPNDLFRCIYVFAYLPQFATMFFG